MASGKEYEMLFKLNAQLGKEFSGTFSTAQKSLSATQKEINALAKQQADISSYQKQQKAVEATARKLEDLKKEYDNIQREIQETEGFSSDLENKLVEKQRAIDKTSEAYENQTKKLNEWQDELRKSGVDVANLTEESEKLKGKINELAEEQEKAKKSYREFGEEGTSAFEAIGSALIAAGIEKGLKEIHEWFVTSTEDAGKYADEINTTSTIYGISAEQLQVFYYAAELVDVSVEALTSSFQKNTRAMYSAANGSSNVVDAYESLGVSVVDAEGNLRDSQTVYWEVIDALSSLTNETERDGIAMTLLGRSAMELNPLIKAGSTTMKSYGDEAQKVGYILSDGVLKSLGKLDDEEQKQKNILSALKNEIGGQLSPAMKKQKELQNELLSGVLQFVKEHPGVTKGIYAVVTVTLSLVKAYLAYKAVKVSMIAYNKIHNALQKEEIANHAASAGAKETETVATAHATAAQTALNIAMYACPIIALVGGLASLIGIFDDFSSSVDNGTLSLQEFDEQSITAKQVEYKIELSDKEKTQAETTSVLDELEQFFRNGDSYVLSHSAQIKAVVENLNTDFEGLGLTFDETTGQLSLTFDQIKTIVAGYQQLGGKTDALSKYYALLKKRGELQEKYDRLKNEYESIDTRDLKHGTEEWDNYFSVQKAYLDTQEELIAANQELYKMEQLGSEVSEANISSKIESAIVSIESLSRAYNAAYEAAKESIEGQFSLWDMAPVVSATSAQSVITNLETQKAYWSDYNTDIKDLLSRSGEIEGLSELISTFADGSSQSVNMIRGMAKATDQELSKMVANWKEVQEQQDETAQNLADLKTNYQNQLDEYTETIRDAVEGMVVLDEAKDAANSTIDAYIDALKNRKNDIRAELNALRGIISESFEKTRNYIASGKPYGIDYGSGNYWFKNKSDETVWGHFASGTSSADPGYALVGELGPELVKFRGGEEVITADQTKEIIGEYIEVISMLPAFVSAIRMVQNAAIRPLEIPIGQSGGQSVSVVISPSFVVESSDADIEGRLRVFASELVGEVVDGLEEAGIDAKRREYS